MNRLPQKPLFFKKIAPTNSFYWLGFLLLFFPCFLFAQISLDKKVVEEINDKIGDSYQLISLDKNGFLFIQQSDEMLKSFKNEFIITHYDTALNPTWKRSTALDYDAKISLYCIEKNYFYVLIQKQNFEHDIIELNLDNGFISFIKYKKIMNFDIRYFEVIDEVLYLGGSVNENPVLLQYDPKSERPYKILGGINQLKAELIEVRKQHGYIATLLHDSNKNQQKIYGHIFEKGQHVSQWSVEAWEEHYFMNARLYIKSTTEQFIFGTYSLSKQGRSQGIYVGFIKDNEQKYMHFYDFANLKNYLNYVGEKRKKKILEKVKNRKQKGKHYHFEHSVTVRGLIDKENKLFLIAENYLPIYNNEVRPSIFRNSLANASGMYNQPLTTLNRTATSYRFRNSMVCAFDKNGKLIWDNAFEFDDLENSHLESGLQFRLQEDSTTMMLLEDNKLIQKTTFKSQENPEIESLSLDSLDKNKVNQRDEKQLIHWYGNYFLWYGIESQKNRQDVFSPKRFFYFSKIRPYQKPKEEN